MAKSKKKVAKRKTLTEDQLKKREQMYFQRKIRNIFTTAGFHYIPTQNHEMKIGLRKVEVDALFIYENVWLICEDTTAKSHIREHIRKKEEATKEIFENFDDFRDKLIDLFPDKADVLSAFATSRIKHFSLYFSKYGIHLDRDDYKLFQHLTFVHPQTLEYFNWMVKAIRKSARFELFRFLNLSKRDIGILSSSPSTSAEITAPIIYPKEFTGIKDNVRVVSFMMSAEELLETSYVLRKDNWQQTIWLYQRLIDPKRIKDVRSFLEENGEAFYNNIIVALPDNIRFRDASGKEIQINEIAELEGNCTLLIPREYNSICVIDGQHRIYAHYESGVDSKQERRINLLRKQLHLLVTGLVFPKEMSKENRIQMQSKIFLDINSNAKPVPRHVLLQIKRIKSPIDSESIGQLVVEKLNENGPFKKLLHISTFGEGWIKTASIVRFALRYLVTTTPAEGKKSLYEYWSGDKDKFNNLNDDEINNYADYCAGVINSYFISVKKHFPNDWANPDSKLMTVVAINGFIIAFTRQLPFNGVKDTAFFDNQLNNWQYDFSKEGFLFTASQYRKLSTVILREVFNLSDEESRESPSEIKTTE